MKSITAEEIVLLVHPDATFVSLREMDGTPCRPVTVEELKALAANGHVAGLVTGRGKLRQIRLTVPPNKAFDALGETGARIKGLQNSDASITTKEEELPNLPMPITQHHKQRCASWPHVRTAAQVRTIRQLLRSDQHFAEMAKGMATLYPGRPVLELAGSLTELEPRLAAKAKRVIELYRDPAMTDEMIAIEMHLSWGGIGKIMAAFREPMRLPHEYHPPIQQRRTVDNGTEKIESVEQGIPRFRVFRLETQEKEPKRGLATCTGDGGFKALIPYPSAEFERYANAPNATVKVVNGQTHIHLHDVSGPRAQQSALSAAA